MKKLLHKKYGWFKCQFSPLDAYEKELQCKWCGYWWKSNGEKPYIGGMVLTKTDKQT